MALETFKAVSKLQEGMKVECSTRGHKIVLDEPKQLGGTDEGMNPVEATLCALGACQAIVARCFARAKGVNLQEYRVELEGDLDTDGFLGKSDVRPGMQNIRAKVYIKSDSPEEKLKEFVEFVEKTCPVGDTIKNSANMSTELIIE
ncbi:OsmC family protein [Wansuia hejianensis]|uniref:OsmC family protein n=1 Tax=Wansuia hejianensis TaxID=2763667 RepID=A0A926F0X6_9FIRM|nr:OsmC family protein [Wansuia hejianensis]MBC8591077.1 OsmC family protein [Wansuia hejianensis]